MLLKILSTEGRLRPLKLCVTILIFFALLELTLQLLYINVERFQGVFLLKIWRSLPNLLNSNIAGSQFHASSEILYSIFRTFFAIALSIFIGLLLSFILVIGHIFRDGLRLYIDFVRSIPITFLIPFIYLFPELSKSFWTPAVLASIPCSLILASSIFEYCKNVDEDVICAARAFFGFDLSVKNKFFYIWYFYAAKIVSGFKIGLATIIPYAVILVGVVESFSIGGGSGMGYLIFQASSNSWIDRDLSVVTATGLYGIFGFIMLCVSRWLQASD